MRTRGYAGIVFLLIACLTFVACNIDVSVDVGVRGSGDLIVESRDVSGFDEIVVLGSGEVIITVTGTESLMIQAEDNIMPLLTTEVRGGRLELGSEESFSTTRGITYTITAADLAGVEINGSGDITASGIDTDTFEVTIDGSGNVVPAGSANEITVEINGSGEYDGEGLIAPLGSVEVSGSGSVLINATDELDVGISGSGDVTYIGAPSVTEHISGSGSVSRR